MYAITLVGYIRFGAAHVRGTSQNLSQAFIATLESLGGEAWFNNGAKKIIVKDGKVKIKEVIPNYGTKKYLVLRDKEACIDESKIEQDARWDGLHGVLANDDTLSPTEIISRYRGLWHIEESFRINKHDLKMRPVYHWTPERIRAHILICFIAYALVRQAMYRTARQYQPMSFEKIRNELLHAQVSILVDTATKKKYIMPSKTTAVQKKLYHIFGLKRSEVPRPMT